MRHIPAAITLCFTLPTSSFLVLALALLPAPALAGNTLDSAPTVAPSTYLQHVGGAGKMVPHSPHAAVVKTHPKTRTRHVVHVLKHMPGHHYTTGPASGGHYRNVDGVSVHRPMAARTAPAGACAQCEDGTYSFAQHHRGACSHHGGVKVWL